MMEANQSTQTVSTIPHDENNENKPQEPGPEPYVHTPMPKGSAFWLTFTAVCVSVFLSALDLTAVGTALPTITADLDGGDDFSWVGSAYALSSTAFLPLSGHLADAFGRRPIMLGSILLFAIGSALSGASQNMNMLIAARSESTNSSCMWRVLISCLELSRVSEVEVSST